MIFTEPTLQDIADSLAEWKLGDFQSIHRLSGGLANSNFRVHRISQSPLVLRICDECSPHEADRIARHTHWVASHGIPTPAPIATPTGELTRVKDGRAWLWMPFIEGEPLKLDCAALYELGQLMARLHRIPAPSDLPCGLQIGLDFIEQLLADRTHVVAQFFDELRMHCDNLRIAIPVDLPHGLIHGDIHPANIISNNQQIVALLDFEAINTDWKALDLGMALAGCGWDRGRPVLKLWQALVQGYHSVTPLTSAEWSALPDLARYADLANCAWRYHQFVVLQPHLDMHEHYLELLQRFKIPIPTSELLMDTG